MGMGPNAPCLKAGTPVTRSTTSLGRGRREFSQDPSSEGPIFFAWILLSGTICSFLCVPCALLLEEDFASNC